MPSPLVADVAYAAASCLIDTYVSARHASDCLFFRSLPPKILLLFTLMFRGRPLRYACHDVYCRHAISRYHAAAFLPREFQDHAEKSA